MIDFVLSHLPACIGGVAIVGFVCIALRRVTGRF